MLAFLRNGLEHGWSEALSETAPEDGWVYPGRSAELPAQVPTTVQTVVHHDSVADVAEMDQKLVGARAEHWGGRDLPFLVALDGGGETPVPGSARTARGATTAAYGIDSFPTTLLVNKQGLLVGPIHPHAPGAQEQIEKLLAE